MSYLVCIIHHLTLLISHICQMNKPSYWYVCQLKAYSQGYNFSFFKNLFILFIFIFGCVGSCHCVRAFSSCGEQGLLLVAVRGLLIVVASLVAEHRLQARGLQQLQHAGSVVVAHGLQSAGSVVVVHGLSCFTACGIFPDQGSNPCPLHWQADS